MSTEAIRKAQEILTVDGRNMLDIESLSAVYSIDDLVKLIRKLISEKTDEIRDHLTLDVTSAELDRSVSERFRYRMALRILRKEVMS